MVLFYRHRDILVHLGLARWRRDNQRDLTLRRRSLGGTGRVPCGMRFAISFGYSINDYN